MKNKKYYIPFTLLVLFIINSLLVVNNKYNVIDKNVHDFVIKFSSETMTKIMKVFTFLGSTPFIIGLCILIFIILMLLKKKDYAFKCAGILVISTLLNNIVKTFSYPSGHTMASVTLYGFLIYYLFKTKISKSYKILFSILLGIIPFVVAISRIYLGAHYFSDVFGAMLLSLALLTSIDLLYDKVKKNNKTN